MSNYSSDQQIPESIKTQIKTDLEAIDKGIENIEPRISALQTAITNDNYTGLTAENNINDKIQAAHKLYTLENNMNYLKSAKIAYNKLDEVYKAKETALNTAHESELATQRSKVEQSEEAKTAAEKAAGEHEDAKNKLQGDIVQLNKTFEKAEEDYNKTISTQEQTISTQAETISAKDTTIKEKNDLNNELGLQLGGMATRIITKDAELTARIAKNTADITFKDAEHNNKIIEIQRNLSILIGSLSSETILGTQVVENQKKVSSYLDKEQTRLSNEKNKIEDNVDLIKREAILSDTRKKRTTAYNYILVVFILTMALALVLHYLKKSIIFLPSFLFNFLIVLTLSGGLIYMVNLYLDIIKRDPIYYDKLVFSPPTDLVTDDEKAAAAAAAEAQSAALAKLCQTADCCDKVTNAWNEDKGLCMPIDQTNEENKDAFTNIFKSECCKI
jgi:hypothetical protein